MWKGAYLDDQLTDMGFKDNIGIWRSHNKAQSFVPEGSLEYQDVRRGLDKGTGRNQPAEPDGMRVKEVSLTR